MKIMLATILALVLLTGCFEEGERYDDCDIRDGATELLEQRGLDCQIEYSRDYDCIVYGDLPQDRIIIKCEVDQEEVCE